MTPAQDRGAAVLCDLDGRGLSIVRDDLGLADRLTPGTLVADIAGGVGDAKIQGFLRALRDERAVFNWEVPVLIDGRATLLHAGGGRLGDRLFVVFAASRDALARLNDDLMRINNEQMNDLRAAMQAVAARDRQARASDGAILDELALVNNELANLQRELVRKNVELETLNEQKSQWLGIAAHDLRSPLGVIQNFSDFLIADASDRLDDEHKEFLGIIRSTSAFMLGLIDDVLDVSQIESGQLHLELQPIDLGVLVRRNVALNRLLAEQKGLTLALTLPNPDYSPGLMKAVLPAA